MARPFGLGLEVAPLGPFSSSTCKPWWSFAALVLPTLRRAGPGPCAGTGDRANIHTPESRSLVLVQCRVVAFPFHRVTLASCSETEPDPCPPDGETPRAVPPTWALTSCFRWARLTAKKKPFPGRPAPRWPGATVELSNWFGYGPHGNDPALSGPQSDLPGRRPAGLAHRCCARAAHRGHRGGCRLGGLVARPSARGGTRRPPCFFFRRIPE